MKKPLNLKKLLLPNVPYILAGLYATNFGEAWRIRHVFQTKENSYCIPKLKFD